MARALPVVEATRTTDVAPETKRWLDDHSRPSRRWIVLAVVAGITEGVLLVVQASLVAAIVHGAFLAGRSAWDMGGWFLGLGVTVVARAVASWMRETAGFRAGERVRAVVRHALVDRLLVRDRPAAVDRSAGELATATVEQVEALHDYVALYLPQRAVAAVVPLVIVVAVAPLSWAGALMLAITAPLIPVFAWLVGVGAARASRKQFTALARLGAHFVDRLQGLQTLRLLRRTAAEAEAVGVAAEEYRVRTLRVLRIAFLTSAVLEFFSALGLGLMAVYLGMTLLGSLDFGLYGRALTFDVALFMLILAAEFYLPLRVLGGLFHARASAHGAAETLRRVFEEHPVAGALPAPDRPLEGPLRLEGVGVRLGPDRRTVLRGVDLVVSPGERVAVVGPSGAGKTTLLRVLLGLIQPTAGRVLVGEQDLFAVDPEAWRARLAWVGQQPRLFHGSLRDNIALGRPARPASAVEAAARDAGVLDFARELPEGLDTVVGELGVGLSGGQVQRVALARALLAAAPLVLLDEPTANLDGATEAGVLAALERLEADRTVVMVTHRIPACRTADRIVVLEAGRVVETGDHDELVAAGGLYADMLARAGRVEPEVTS